MTDKDYLKLAVEQAKKSMEQGGFPAGAIVVKNGNIIAQGVSLGYQLHDPTSHAETSAIREACRKLQTSDLSGAVLYESLECCTMCFSVAFWSGISKIVFACRKTSEMVKKQYYEGSINNELLNESNTRKMELLFIPDFEEEVLRIVEKWERTYGN